MPIGVARQRMGTASAAGSAGTVIDGRNEDGRSTGDTAVRSRDGTVA